MLTPSKGVETTPSKEVRYISQSSFSQYDPKIVYPGGPPEDSAFVFTKKSGFWRDYGFGITCIFKSDLLKTGGFDTSIQGWGLEDVDLFMKVVNSSLKVFRSQEAGYCACLSSCPV